MFRESEMPSTKKPVTFILVSLIILFLPGIGDFRWVGLMTFIYIGLPWYILAVKDKVHYQQISIGREPKFKVHSPTLFVFGLISVVLGVGLDILLICMLFQETSIVSALAILYRILIGLPIFGFGAYLMYMSIGLQRHET